MIIEAIENRACVAGMVRHNTSALSYRIIEALQRGDVTAITDNSTFATSIVLALFEAFDIAADSAIEHKHHLKFNEALQRISAELMPEKQCSLVEFHYEPELVN